MRLFEAQLSDTLLKSLIAMSAAWEAENSTYGYHINSRQFIEKNRVFVAEEQGAVVGYLLGKRCVAERSTSVMEQGTAYFEIEELYVTPERRNCGVGKKLFQFVEDTARSEGIGILDLITATKDHRRILHFYIDELGMEFWSAHLYKKLKL